MEFAAKVHLESSLRQLDSDTAKKYGVLRSHFHSELHLMT